MTIQGQEMEFKLFNVHFLFLYWQDGYHYVYFVFTKSLSLLVSKNDMLDITHIRISPSFKFSILIRHIFIIQYLGWIWTILQLIESNYFDYKINFYYINKNYKKKITFY